MIIYVITIQHYENKTSTRVSSVSVALQPTDFRTADHIFNKIVILYINYFFTFEIFLLQIYVFYLFCLLRNQNRISILESTIYSNYEGHGRVQIDLKSIHFDNTFRTPFYITLAPF